MSLELFCVCVVGCGVIGSLFVVYLVCVEGVEVWGYDVLVDYVDVINIYGLCVMGVVDFMVCIYVCFDFVEILLC